MLAKPLPDRPLRNPHPLGPLVYRTWPTRARQVRGWAAFGLAACIAILLTATALNPDPRGFDTHTQLGLPRCSWPVSWGIPCPTCGMTTAFALTARGQWLAAARVQPLGFLLAAGVAMGGVLCGVALLTGRSWHVNWYRVRPGWVALGVLVLVLASWGFKILVMRGEIG